MNKTQLRIADNDRRVEQLYVRYTLTTDKRLSVSAASAALRISREQVRSSIRRLNAKWAAEQRNLAFTYDGGGRGVGYRLTTTPVDRVADSKHKSAGTAATIQATCTEANQVGATDFATAVDLMRQIVVQMAEQSRQTTMILEMMQATR